MMIIELIETFSVLHFKKKSSKKFVEWYLMKKINDFFSVFNWVFLLFHIVKLTFYWTHIETYLIYESEWKNEWINQVQGN